MLSYDIEIYCCVSSIFTEEGWTALHVMEKVVM